MGLFLWTFLGKGLAFNEANSVSAMGVGSLLIHPFCGIVEARLLEFSSLGAKDLAVRECFGRDTCYAHVLKKNEFADWGEE